VKGAGEAGGGPADDHATSGGHRRPGGHAPQDQPVDGGPGPAAWGRRFSLRDWRVRSRLLLLIAVPVLVAVVFGGVAVVSSLRTAQSYQQVQRLAVLAGDATNLAQALQTEREDTVTFIAMGNNGGRVNALSPNAQTRAQAADEQLLLQSDYRTSKLAAAQVSSVAATIGGSYPALAQTQAQAAITAIGDLSALRTAATTTKLPVLTVINDYGTIITQLLALENEVSAGSKDASLADTVQVTTLISSMKEEASEQQAIVTSALRPSQQGALQLGSESLSVLDEEAAEQAANLSAFNLTATAAQRQVYNSQLSSALAAEAQQELQQASSQLASNSTSPSDPAFVVATGNASYITSALGSVERQLMSSIIAQSGSLRDGATEAALVEGAGVLLLLVLALVLIALVGQSMIRPLRRLRAGALEIAGVRLPETVRLMAETDGEGVSLEVEPIDVHSADEIGEVARAFDQVHREALRLAANEAALRGNVNAMFVNLSRRSQSLVERQIRLIDDLEQGEQDPERLSSLFQMDHLATRMRRNSENLLVLAGHDESRRWNQPVALVDVLRAALSEIEQYERVTLNVQPGIAVRGQAVSDVVHLTAELVENATSFSAADTPVTIAGHLLSSGGVLLEITDQGVGMGAEEMAHANWRLDNPPVVDVAVSRRMGLFVVARLAARHGIRVRLRPAASGGLIALVWLPDETIMHETADGTPGMRRDSMAEPALGPFADGAFAGVGAGTNGGSTSIWGDDGRSVTEQEVNAARAPRFAPLRADAEDTSSSSLGPKRIPGAGPRPGGWATTGPLPVFRTVPRPADGEPELTSPQPLVTGPFPLVTGPPAVTGQSPALTGQEPVIGPDAELEAAADTEAPALELPVAAAPAAFDFGSGPIPAEGNGSDSSLTTPYTVLGAPASLDTAPSRSAVIVPPADGSGEEHRLPIFEAVESDWFRRGRPAVGRSSSEPEPSTSNGWATTPADEGWRAAETVSAPTSGGVTPAGLPKRVPQANLVPGAAGAAAGSSPATTPSRSAAATRERFASFQRGVREGRAAASQAGSDDGEDEGTA
jgi:hypothetical protein